MMCCCTRTCGILLIILITLLVIGAGAGIGAFFALSPSNTTEDTISYDGADASTGDGTSDADNNDDGNVLAGSWIDSIFSTDCQCSGEYELQQEPKCMINEIEDASATACDITTKPALQSPPCTPLPVSKCGKWSVPKFGACECPGRYKVESEPECHVNGVLDTSTNHCVLEDIPLTSVTCDMGSTVKCGVWIPATYSDCECPGVRPHLDGPHCEVNGVRASDSECYSNLKPPISPPSCSVPVLSTCPSWTLPTFTLPCGCDNTYTLLQASECKLEGVVVPDETKCAGDKISAESPYCEPEPGFCTGEWEISGYTCATPNGIAPVCDKTGQIWSVQSEGTIVCRKQGVIVDDSNCNQTKPVPCQSYPSRDCADVKMKMCLESVKYAGFNQLWDTGTRFINAYSNLYLVNEQATIRPSDRDTITARNSNTAEIRLTQDDGLCFTADVMDHAYQASVELDVDIVDNNLNNQNPEDDTTVAFHRIVDPVHLERNHGMTANQSLTLMFCCDDDKGNADASLFSRFSVVSYSTQEGDPINYVVS